MMQTKTSPKARRLVEQAFDSYAQADRYREMAAALRKLDPNYADELVGREVARLIDLGRELDEDAEDRREQAIALGFRPGPGQIW